MTHIRSLPTSLCLAGHCREMTVPTLVPLPWMILWVPSAGRGIGVHWAWDWPKRKESACIKNTGCAWIKLQLLDVHKSPKVHPKFEHMYNSCIFKRSLFSQRRYDISVLKSSTTTAQREQRRVEHCGWDSARNGTVIPQLSALNPCRAAQHCVTKHCPPATASRRAASNSNSIEAGNVINH